MTENLKGKKTTATSSTYENSNEYEFQYVVKDLDKLIPSHTDTLAVNSKYPQELQPRLRDRSASKIQIDRIANHLSPKGLLNDTGHIDTGIMIIGPDNVVESGNGRVLALRRARSEYPDKFQEYQDELQQYLKKYGISAEKLAGIKSPVLVRQRITPVDRVQFTAEANASATMSMSPHEQALQDAKRITADMLTDLKVGEDQSIDQALKSSANHHIIGKFVQQIPVNERAAISDSKGNLNSIGLIRLKSALFAKTYPGKAGERLSRTFSESLEPGIKTIENAMFQSLPSMAKANGLIESGSRERNLLPTNDIAAAVEAYAALKESGMMVKDYMSQGKMFGDTLNPLQNQILGHLDTVGRSGKVVREFLNDIAERIEKAPAKGQISMLGDEIKATKEVIINDAINKQRAEKGHEPVIVATHTPESERLEEPDTGRNEGSGELAKPVPKGMGPVDSSSKEHKKVETIQLGNFFATERSVIYHQVKTGRKPKSVRTTIHYGPGKISKIKL